MMLAMTDTIPVLTQGRRLEWARELADPPLTQQDMADRLGVTVRTVYRWERAGAWMPPMAIDAWARHTGVSYEWLIGKAPTQSEPSSLDRRRYNKRTKASPLGMPLPSQEVRTAAGTTPDQGIRSSGWSTASLPVVATSTLDQAA